MNADDSARRNSMWFCPECRVWVGWKLDECVSGGHDRPRWPLYNDDVEFDHAGRVTPEDRLRAKIRGLVAELRRLHR